MSDAWAQAVVVPNFWVDAVEPLRDFYLEKLGFSHMMGIVGKDGNVFGVGFGKDEAEARTDAERLLAKMFPFAAGKIKLELSKAF